MKVLHATVIGSAGRKDDARKMNQDLYRWMYTDARSRIEKYLKAGQYDRLHLHCGGAAWVDHICVSCFKAGMTDYMTFHMPAPFIAQHGRFSDNGPVGATANRYHERFSRVLGQNTLTSIAHTLLHPHVEMQVYNGFFPRNIGLGKAVYYMLAYTWGTGKTPRSRSGTAYTWEHSPAPAKLHVPLELLKNHYERKEEQC